MPAMTYRPRLISTFTLAVLAYSQVCSATCSTFSPLGNPYNSEQIYTTVGRTSIVSAVVNCTGLRLGSQPPTFQQKQCNTTTCSLSTPLNYFVRESSYLNVSLPSDADLSDIFKLVKTNVTGLNSIVHPTDLNVTMVHFIGEVNICLGNGSAGYWGFTPTLNCIQGVLGGCEGGMSGLEGAAVTACGVQMLEGFKSYDGILSVVQTNGVPAGGEPAPPNATLTAGSSVPTNGAGLVGVGLDTYALGVFLICTITTSFIV